MIGQKVGSIDAVTAMAALSQSMELSQKLERIGNEPGRVALFKELCVTIRSSIKDPQRRTEYFKILCRVISRYSYLSSSGQIRIDARSLMTEFRHIFHHHLESSPSRFEGDSFLDPIDFTRPLPYTPAGHRLDHLDWALLPQGKFLELHSKSMEAIMNTDGPLPRPWRHYIAMMGASQFRCEYLVRHELERFLLAGGDPAWLTQKSATLPRKLQGLAVISAVMAHKPWDLNRSHIDQLISNYRWSASELVHALIVLATFHSLPSLVFGAGIKLEDDLLLPEEHCNCSNPNENSVDPLIESEPVWSEISSLPRCFSLNESAPSLLQRLVQQVGGKQDLNPRSNSSASTEEPINAFEGFGVLNEPVGSGAGSPAHAAVRSQEKLPRTPMPNRMGEEERSELSQIMSAQPSWKHPFSSLVGCDGVCEYKDFAQKSDAILHTMSFSWEDHGMMVLSQQVPEITDCINAEHLHALEFTTNSIGEKSIESTTTVREAIVKYVQRMYGVFHDDYRYDMLNKILPVMDKAYFKKLACYPDRITRVDYWRMRKFEGFSSRDLIHCAHIVAQTKRVVELTWAMKALMNYQGTHM